MYYEEKELLHLVAGATAIEFRNSNPEFLLVRSGSSDIEDILTPNPSNTHWGECSSKKLGERQWFKTLLIRYSSISMLRFYTNTAGISNNKAKLLLLIYAMTNLHDTQIQKMIINLPCAASNLM